MADIIELNHTDSDVYRALASVGASPMTYHTMGLLPHDVVEAATAPKLPLTLQLAVPQLVAAVAAAAPPSWLARLLAREDVAADPQQGPTRLHRARPTADSLS